MPWSNDMYTPFLHLLDRNAVALIKDSNAGKIQTDKKKIDFLRRLRQLDSERDYVSPLLSIMEGEHSRKDTAEEKVACQRKESGAVRRFFKLANTDSDFLDANGNVLGQVFTEYREGGWIAREAFLRAAAPLISSAVKKNERKTIEDQLIAMALEAGLTQLDPLLVICLACLYGSEDARKLIKPSNLNTYNVLSDLHVLSRVALVQSVAGDHGAALRVRVVSRDSGLMGVLSHIELVDCKLRAEGELQLTLRYGEGLFPALSNDHYLNLLDKLISVAAGY
jgi:hypothetical protein